MNSSNYTSTVLLRRMIFKEINDNNNNLIKDFPAIFQNASLIIINNYF